MTSAMNPDKPEPPAEGAELKSRTLLEVGEGGRGEALGRGRAREGEP